LQGAEGAEVSKSGLDELYKPHLQTLMRRTETSLAASGFDALVIHAGAPPTLFLDDQDYPYKVNPQFKVWVPITDNPRCVLVFVPGTRLKVLFHQPNDYWHKPAALPISSRWPIRRRPMRTGPTSVASPSSVRMSSAPAMPRVSIHPNYCSG
jgi:hypothetical protein